MAPPLHFCNDALPCTTLRLRWLFVSPFDGLVPAGTPSGRHGDATELAGTQQKHRCAKLPLLCCCTCHVRGPVSAMLTGFEA